MDNNIFDKPISAYTKLVASKDIIGVDETKKVSFAHTIFRLNPTIHHLVVFRENTRQPLGVLTKREFMHKYSGEKDRTKTIREVCRTEFNLQDEIIGIEKYSLEREHFVFSDTKWNIVVNLITTPYERQDRSKQKLDYVLVITNDHNIHTIITYKDVLKYLKAENHEFTLNDILYTKSSADSFAFTYKGQILSDIEDSLNKYRSVPVFENIDKQSFIGIVFDNSVTTDDVYNDLEVTDTQIMTPLSRFSRCKMKASLQPAEMIDLFLEYPEFTSIPVFDESNKFIGLMSYIDLLKSILEKSTPELKQ